MMIEKTTTHYLLWEDKGEYVVTTRRRVEVYRGSKEDCNKFIETHPYGGATRR